MSSVFLFTTQFAQKRKRNTKIDTAEMLVCDSFLHKKVEQIEKTNNIIEASFESFVDVASLNEINHPNLAKQKVRKFVN